MSNKGILGGKVTNAIDIHQEALHLFLEPKSDVYPVSDEGPQEVLDH